MKRSLSYLVALSLTFPLLTSCFIKRWIKPEPAPVSISSPAGGTREENVLSAVNSYRSSKGKSALRRDTGLDAIARDHSVYMMKHRSKGLVNHDGYPARVRQIQQKYGYGHVFENAGAGSGKGAVGLIVGYWVNSSQHRSNMLGKWEATGIGVAVDSDGTAFVTQIYAGR